MLHRALGNLCQRRQAWRRLNESTEIGVQMSTFMTVCWVTT
jgi:hypothetical protein